MTRLVLALVLGLSTLAAAAQQPLTVSAAASLAEVMKELAPRFEALHPGTTVRLNLAASNQLLQQVAQGAPVDVFVSADEDTIAKGIEQKLFIADTRSVFAANTLVLVRPMAGLAPVRSLADLTAPAVKRIAIGKPASVPAGRYAQQALTRAGSWDALQPKLVPADSVRQVLDYVVRGEVDAGFVYATDAAIVADKVTVVMPVTGGAPIVYPAIVVSDSRREPLARAFVQFLGSPVAQDALARRGFGRP